ncbi:MAG: DNA (cytosine-5-)-methyltransferase [Opitutae bacterium]
MELRFIDLFCGIGGFRQALEPRGHKCVLSSDWDPHAQSVYRENYGDSPLGDITELADHNIPPHDLLCGGFPCQPFSISGNQKGFADARGTLLHQILRIAQLRQPDVLLLENVRNYLSHNGGRTMAFTLDLLDRAGYQVFFEILNSSEYGVPQKRERLFFVCFRKNLQINGFSFPKPLAKDIALEDILLPEDDTRLSPLWICRNDFRFKKIMPETRQNKPLRIGTTGKGGQGERIYSPKGHAITLSAFGGGIGAKTGMYLIGKKVRRLHPVECCRLMGFPEGFVLHKKINVSYKQFGNSVVVPLVSSILVQIEKVLKEAKLKAA